MKAKYFFDVKAKRIVTDPNRNYAVLEPQYDTPKKIGAFGVFDLINLGGEIAQIISIISDEYAAVWVVPHDLSFHRQVFFVSAADLFEHSDLIMSGIDIKKQIEK